MQDGNILQQDNENYINYLVDKGFESFIMYLKKIFKVVIIAIFTFFTGLFILMYLEYRQFSEERTSQGAIDILDIPPPTKDTLLEKK